LPGVRDHRRLLDVVTRNRIVIVGASVAGVTCADSLRELGYSGELTLVGNEQCLPYERPPLSKQVLVDDWDEPDLWLRRPSYYADMAIDLRLGMTAVDVDPDADVVRLSDGSEIAFHGLVIATGVTPRRLTFDSAGRCSVTLRSLEDARTLRQRLLQARRVLIVGAGFLGTELAAAARSLDCEVTLVDPSPLPLGRVVGSTVGSLIVDLHRQHGVEVLCGTSVAGLHANRTRYDVHFSDGSRQGYDLVVACIGSTPNNTWLSDSGLLLDGTDGVPCDEHGLVAPNIYAAGDVCSWWNPSIGRRVRIEHRMSAAEQGMAVAHNLLSDGAEPFGRVPYFWSDQYDVRLQMVGLLDPSCHGHVVLGDVSEGRFAIAYYRDESLAAVVGWNAARRVRQLSQFIGIKVPRGELSSAER
jgi:NADPH-dependent 2,4-dienoyl-CoA reductase/sulfur reductase-like enzyme